MKKFTFPFLLLACMISVVHAQPKTRIYIDDPLWAPREHNVDMQHMRLELSFVPEKGLVKGKVTHRFTPLLPTVDSVFLDGPGITIKEAFLNGKTARFKTTGKGVIIYAEPALRWQTTDSISLIYEATPFRGLYFVGWNDPNNISRKQIWSQGQSLDNRLWIPMYDEMNDKVSTDVHVTFDGSYQVLSNGTKLREKENKDGTKTWHYRMKQPNPPYLIMIGIGKYAIKETKSKSGVPMRFWYYPDWKDRLEPSSRYSEQIMDFLEQETGFPYGWDSYSQIPVQDFPYGAMENTTATVFGDFYMVDERGFLDRSYVGTNAHELVHQWFGDLVTARSEAHHWLQESFATYYSQLFMKEIYGQDYFDWARREANNQSLGASLRDKLPIAHSEAGTTRHYPKGAFVLNMLKYITGREAYNKSIKAYLEKHKYGNVDSEDLLTAFHETLGLSLDWFWDQWVYRGGEPAYQVSYEDAALQGEQFTEFSVKQVHPQSDIVGLFKMPVYFDVYYTDGTKDRKQVWISEEQTTVRIPNPSKKKVDFVLFDPNSEILKSVSFEKPFEQLKSQALRAEHMLDRYDALLAMRSMPLDQKRDLLLQVFGKETFHAPKGEVVFQLAADKERAGLELLKKAIQDKDVQVRKSVVQHLKKIPAEVLPLYESLLKDPSYDIIASALDKLSLEYPDKTAQYLEASKGVEGNGRNVIIKWLEISAANTGNADHIKQLTDYTSNSYEFRARTTAMASLKRLNHFDEKVMKHLFDALFSPNGRLAGPAGETLKYFNEQVAFKKQIAAYIASRQWTAREKKAIDGAIR